MNKHYPIHTEKEGMYRKCSDGVIRKMASNSYEKRILDSETEKKRQIQKEKKTIQKKIDKKTTEIQEISKRIVDINKEISDNRFKITAINLYLSKKTQLPFAGIMSLIGFATFAFPASLIACGISLGAQLILALAAKVTKEKAKDRIESLKMDKDVEIYNRRECEKEIRNCNYRLSVLEGNVSINQEQMDEGSIPKENSIPEEVFIISNSNQSLQSSAKQFIKRQNEVKQ